MNISIGSDHAGFELKENLMAFLYHKKNTLVDSGTHSTASCDYPDYAHEVAKNVTAGIADFGILICGSGQGVAITANKHQNIRAALAWTAEIAALARQHNNANVLCLPARFITETEAMEIVETFLQTPFEGGRHQTRVDKIAFSKVS
jgi:ribose 5-phosphate isomerase B